MRLGLQHEFLTMPHPLALIHLQQVPHWLLHGLDTPEHFASHRLAAAAAASNACDVIPKASSATLTPTASLTSPLPLDGPGTPAPALHSLLSLGAGRGCAEGERLVGGTATFPTALAPVHPAPLLPLSARDAFSSPANLAATSPYGRKLFSCLECRYTTDRRNNLKRHMLTMHQLSAKMLECCGVLFRTKAALREHALYFHSEGYTCFYCGRRFCRKALLKRHLSVHNGQKEFLCNACDYATSHKSNLERHRRVHVRQAHDDGQHDAMADDATSNISDLTSTVDASCDELSVCSDDDDEEINVHSID